MNASKSGLRMWCYDILMKRLIKWVLRIILLCVVLIVLLLVFKNTILRLVAEHQIRAQTGMDVKIGKFSSGLFSPVVTIENLRLYNTPQFGGTEFLTIPELHIEVDSDALVAGKLRITLARLNLSELDVVKNADGQTNIVTMLAKMPKGSLAPHGIRIGRKKFDFDGIDTLNLSLGRMRYIDLKHPENNRDVLINLDNQVFNNIKNEGSVDGILITLWLRSGGASLIRPQDIAGDYFSRKSDAAKKKNKPPVSPAGTNANH
jgi:uncharacterized protein involved in outer membrane biogenesis